MLPLSLKSSSSPYHGKSITVNAVSAINNFLAVIFKNCDFKQIGRSGVCIVDYGKQCKGTALSSICKVTSTFNVLKD